MAICSIAWEEQSHVVNEVTADIRKEVEKSEEMSNDDIKKLPTDGDDASGSGCPGYGNGLKKTT